MKRQYSKIKNTSLLFILALSYSGISIASGFRIPEISTVGVGTSNALVANSTEVGALAYNPAAMSFHSGKALSSGLTHIGYDVDVATAAGNFSSIGEDSFLVPNLYFMAQGYDKLSFGLAINAPFGLETDYAAGTFPVFGTVGVFSALEPALSKIKMVNVNPNMAYKIDDSASFSVGVNFYNLRELVLNTQSGFINGSGTGLGLRLGYLTKMNDWSFGLSYSTSVDVDIKGSAALPPFAGAPPMGAFTSVELPSLLQVGAAYRVNDKLQIEFDIEQTGWSSFDKIDIKNASGTVLTSSVNNWEDATAYRLGVIYQLNDKTKLLFGYSDDPTPQKLEYFSARVPDSDRVLYSVGFTHDMGNDMTMEASYMTADFDGRTVNSTTSYAAGLPVNTDPNGTDAYNGVYDTSVDLFAVGITMKF